VLRALVLHRPWLYLATKNLLVSLVFLGVARFHLFRVGRLLLGAAVLCFLLVDVYWLWLMW
jgi:hypothetical protein